MLNKFAFMEEKYNMPPSNQLRDMWRLWRANKILPNEYFDFRLVNDDMFNYIGLIKSKEIWNKYNTNKEAAAYINNKWKFYHKFPDLPVPETTLLTFDNLSEQIVEVYELSRHTDLFFKPVDGYGGHGAFKITSKHVKRDIEDILLRKYPRGYVYQKALKPHFEMSKFTGSNAIGALRVITLVRQPDTIEIIGAFTKFVGSGNITDYTSNPGNYLVGVDITNWSLTYAMTNSGLESKSYSSLNNHDIYGHEIPVGVDFDEEIYRWVSVVHNNLKLETSLIGWDIAVTNEGIYCLEANLKPGFASLQKADEKGYLNVFEYKNCVYSDYPNTKCVTKKNLTTSWKPR